MIFLYSTIVLGHSLFSLVRIWALAFLFSVMRPFIIFFLQSFLFLGPSLFSLILVWASAFLEPRFLFCITSENDPQAQVHKIHITINRPRFTRSTSDPQGIKQPGAKHYQMQNTTKCKMQQTLPDAKHYQIHISSRPTTT